jgi:protease PrsW
LQDIGYQLLSPEDASSENYPFRRVWRPLITELGIFGGIAAIFIALTTFGILADTHWASIELVMALFPVVAFLWFSVRTERFVFRPRRYLIPVFGLSVIVGNGFAVPVIEQIYTPSQWLPESGFFDRIFGYMAIEGCLCAFILYSVVRYTVWTTQFRLRLDGVAYAAAAAVGYATVLNVRMVLMEDLVLSSMAIRMVTNLYLTTMVALIIGYFLGEMAIGRPPFFWSALGIGIASFIYGIYMAFRGIAVKSGLGLEATANRPLGPAILITVFTALTIWIIAFLIESSDERMAHRQGVERIR